MESPENCPKEIYDLMLSCWNNEPEKRPTFQQLFNIITIILKQDKSNNNYKLIKINAKDNYSIT